MDSTSGTKSTRWLNPRHDGARPRDNLMLVGEAPPLHEFDLRSLSRSYRSSPPGRRSILRTFTVKPSGPHRTEAFLVATRPTRADPWGKSADRDSALAPSGDGCRHCLPRRLALRLPLAEPSRTVKAPRGSTATNPSRRAPRRVDTSGRTSQARLVEERRAATRRTGRCRRHQRCR